MVLIKMLSNYSNNSGDVIYRCGFPSFTYGKWMIVITPVFVYLRDLHWAFDDYDFVGMED